MRRRFKSRDEIGDLKRPSDSVVRKLAKVSGLTAEGLEETMISAREVYLEARANYQLNEWDWHAIRQLKSIQDKIDDIQADVRESKKKALEALNAWNEMKAEDKEFILFFSRLELKNEFRSIEENLSDYIENDHTPQPIKNVTEFIRAYEKARGKPRGRPKKGKGGLPTRPIVAVVEALADLWAQEKPLKKFKPRIRDASDLNSAGRLLFSVAKWINPKHTHNDCRTAIKAYKQR